MRRFRNSDLTEMVRVLLNHGCIAVPTDTVFGLCAAVNDESREKLYEIKDRPKTKAFPVMCADIGQLREIAETDVRAETLIGALMPGPLTVVLRKHPECTCIHGETVAVRMADGVLKELLDALGGPIYLTSANHSGMPECRTPEEIERQCPGIDGILEGTPGYGKASTILDLTQKEIRILREGPVGMEEISRTVKGERRAL